MIRNQWYAVLLSKEVKKNKIVPVIRLGERLVFYRDKKGTLSCFINQCAHRGARFDQGKIIGDRIQCPFHGLEYDHNGQCRYIPANSRLSNPPENFKLVEYPVSEKEGFIFIYWSRTRKPEHPPRFFENLDRSFRRKTFIDPWKTHYSRAIENQLDVSHLPFVHKTTIGAGDYHVVDGPVVRWIDDSLFHLYVYNRRESTDLPKKPAEMPQTQIKPFRLEFLFPNLWQNFIMEKLRIVVAFVPVDDDHTLVYLTTYQKMATIPVIGDLMDYLLKIFNRIVLHQDRRVVETQNPNHSELNMKENLFQADLPIIEYRKKRDALKQSNK